MCLPFLLLFLLLQTECLVELLTNANLPQVKTLQMNSQTLSAFHAFGFSESRLELAHKDYNSTSSLNTSLLIKLHDVYVSKRRPICPAMLSTQFFKTLFFEPEREKT